MDYIVDVENKRLVSSFLSTRTTTPQAAIFGDTPSITVRLVEGNDDGVNLPWRYVDLTGYSIRVAIGNPGGDPTSGTFTLTFDGDTTASLNYNATAAEIDTELNGLASMVTAGGCTVSAVSSGYQVAFDTVGAQNTITATTDSLFPASSAYIYEATTGDGSTNEVQVVTLEVDNSAYVELTTDIAAPSATVTTVREGVTDTTSELQRVEIDGDPYLGTWSVTIGGNTSAAISVDADTADITTAIEGITGIGAGNVVVTGSVLDFTIQFDSSLGNVGTAVIDVANLTGAIGKTGSIDLNTNQMLELLGGAASASSTLEIVKYDTGNSTSDTVLQQAITCRQDVIPDTPASATPFPTYAASSHTHLEASITDLGTAVTLNADTNLTGNGWFLDTDTLAENDAEKVPSQQSVKAYVDTQIAGVPSISDIVDDTTPQLGGSLDVNGQKIVSVSNGNIDIEPNGTGNVLLGNLEFDADQTVGAGQDNYVLTYDDAAGTIGLESAAAGALSNIVEDTTPELGGDLEVSTSRTFNDQSGNELLGFENPGASAVNYLAIKNANTSSGPSLKAVGDNADIDLSLQAKGTGAVNITGTGGRDLKGNKIQTNDKDTITLVGNGSDSHVSITCQTSTNNPSIGVVSTNTNQGLTLNAKGTGNIKLGNLEFDADQSIGAGNDNHVLTYDNASGSVSLEAATGIANVVEDTTPQLGGMLDINGNAIGDGTDEVLSFVVNPGYNHHVQIENNKIAVDHCTITTAGDAADIPLYIETKGQSDITINSNMVMSDRLDYVSAESIGDGTTTFSWSAKNFHKFTFGAQNEVFTFQTPSLPGARYSILHLVLIQDGVGSRTVTWPAIVKWPGGTAPTLSTGANAVDIIKFIYDGTNYYGTYDLNFS